MKPSYKDILALTNAEPLWYDANGVPRFQPFSTELLSSVYARECCLLEIACQNCGQRFHVEMVQSTGAAALGQSLAQAASESMGSEPFGSTLHYGDPPHHGCTGDTMNCQDLRILEFWARDTPFAWTRHPELEQELEKPEGMAKGDA